MTNYKQDCVVPSVTNPPGKPQEWSQLHWFSRTKTSTFLLVEGACEFPQRGATTVEDVVECCLLLFQSLVVYHVHHTLPILQGVWIL